MEASSITTETRTQKPLNNEVVHRISSIFRQEQPVIISKIADIQAIIYLR